MSPELSALLEGVRSNPWDDAPRLVLADWIEEHATSEADSARAALIRAQCLVSLLKWIDKPEFSADIDRTVTELIERHANEWLRPLGDLARSAGFMRGTVWLKCKGEWFLEHGERLSDIVRSWPWIDGLDLSFPATLTGRLAGCPHLAVFPQLRIEHNTLNNGGLPELISSPYLANIRTLDLSSNRLGDKGASTLASANLPRLAGLRLRGTDITPEGIRALLTSTTLGNLAQLDASRSSRPKVSLAPALVECRLPRLTALGVGAWDIGVEGARKLASSSWLGQLTILNLHWNYLGDAGVDALAASPHVTRLTALGLRDNGIKAAGAMALVRSVRLPRLTTLMFGLDDKMGGPAMKALKKRFGDGVWSTRRLRGY
jgi:uncharacterized protein (TIGR02996 family)